MLSTILYIYDSKFSVQQRLRGIFRFARGHEWHVERIEAAKQKGSIKDLIRFWNPQGAIVEGGIADPSQFTPSLFARHRLPVVYCDEDIREDRGVRTSVRLDSGEVAEKATHVLLDLDIDDYAFIGYHTPRDWAAQRLNAFVKIVSKKGRRAHICNPNRHYLRIQDFYQTVSAFLSELPRPCGVLAVNDEIAYSVMQIASLLGIHIPNEMPIIGIDDDLLICENASPPLASVAPDFEASGYAAMEALCRRIADPSIPHKTICITGACVTRRPSVRKFRHNDALIDKALEFIRLKACSTMTIPDIVSQTGISRRSFEKRFLKAVGSGVQAEIDRIRLRRATELLSKSDMTVESIAQQCGYAGSSSLLHLFRKYHNVSPDAWRKYSTSDARKDGPR